MNCWAIDFTYNLDRRTYLIRPLRTAIRLAMGTRHRDGPKWALSVQGPWRDGGEWPKGSSWSCLHITITSFAHAPLCLYIISHFLLLLSLFKWILLFNFLFIHKIPSVWFTDNSTYPPPQIQNLQVINL